MPEFRSLSIHGAREIRPDVFRDERGAFFESYRRELYAYNGLDHHFVQDNISVSARHVLRGMHYQYRRPQGHLVTAVTGRLYDVGLDLRRDSPTFGRYEAVILGSVEANQVFWPPGVAHGFCALEEVNTVLYKCTDYYDPGGEFGVNPLDPDLAIAWPIDSGLMRLNDKDRSYPNFNQLPGHLMPAP